MSIETALMVGLTLLLNFAWFVYLHRRLNDIENDVRKGNKDQQEIKTRLTNMKKRQYDMQTAVKQTLLRALQKSVIAPAKRNNTH